MEDNKRPIGFKRKEIDSEKEPKRLDDYLRKWAFFKLKDGSSVAGYMNNLSFTHVNLLPYQKMSPNSEGRAYYEIEENTLPYTISKDFIGSFSETSREEAENFCEFMNRRLDSEFISQEQQKLNYLDSINQQEDNTIVQVPKTYDMDKLR